MSLPVIGQDPWGDDLNTYLAGLEARIASLEAAQPLPSMIYNYANSTTPPPATGEIRSNGPLGQASTLLYLHKTSAGGLDSTVVLSKVDATYKMYVQDTTDSSTRQWYSITAAVVDQGTWWQIPVVWLSGVTTAANKARPVTVLFTNQV
jgi:hypothetical protein